MPVKVSILSQIDVIVLSKEHYLSLFCFRKRLTFALRKRLEFSSERTTPDLTIVKRTLEMCLKVSILPTRALSLLSENSCFQYFSQKDLI